MKKKISFSGILIIFFIWAGFLFDVNASVDIPRQTKVSSEASHMDAHQLSKRIPFYFIENKGQTHQEVRYYLYRPDYRVFFTKEGVYFGLNKTQPASNKQTMSEWVKIIPVGMDKNVDIIGIQAGKGHVNYYLGKDPKNWHPHISTYAKVVYREAYPGIDIQFYGTQKGLEYDIVLKPGADPAKVRFKYKGAESIGLAQNGDLITRISGRTALRQSIPMIYQDVNGKRVFVNGNFHLAKNCNDWIYSFEIDSYKTHLSLVIDPLVLVYSTYLGGSELDYGWSIDADEEGNAYITGYTNSPDFPSTSSLQPELNDSYDAFITKIGPDGDLIFSTYIGGSGREYCNGIAVSWQGNPYIIGYTNSADFPTRPNNLQPNINGPTDAFIVRLTAGGALVLSTYFGGSEWERGESIAVDHDGNFYITGKTSSPDLPTRWAYQSDLNGSNDIFVAKINSSGSELLYSTYLGGSDSESAIDIAIDDFENVYIVGESMSSDFPIVNAFQPEKKNQYYDGYVLKLSTSDNQLIYSTYLSGSNDTVSPSINAVAVDEDGNAFVTGKTESDDLPVLNAFQPQLQGECSAYVTKIDTSGGLLFSTYLGGTYIDMGEDIAVDSGGNVYIAGTTFSDDFPVKDAVQDALDGPVAVFVTKMNATGTNIYYSTYLNGGGCDNAKSIAVDSNDDVYVAGLTGSSDFPIKNALQPEKAGGTIDAFVFKLRWSLRQIYPKPITLPTFPGDYPEITPLDPLLPVYENPL